MLRWASSLDGGDGIEKTLSRKRLPADGGMLLGRTFSALPVTQPAQLQDG